jgi:hypothetical protein
MSTTTKKKSLINIEEEYDISFREGDVIHFTMSPFHSKGDYEAIVFSHPKYGLYIHKEVDKFKACRDFEVSRGGARKH